MPLSTASTFGAVPAIRRLISSWPPATYLSWHGEPCGLSDTQSCAIEENPMSLPPISSVTSAVSAVSESNCGGFGPGVTFCGAVMSPVLAPLHVGSANSGYARVSCARCA